MKVLFLIAVALISLSACKKATSTTPYLISVSVTGITPGNSYSVQVYNFSTRDTIINEVSKTSDNTFTTNTTSGSTELIYTFTNLVTEAQTAKITMSANGKVVSGATDTGNIEVEGTAIADLP